MAAAFDTFQDADVPTTDTDEYTASSNTAVVSLILSNKTAATVNITVKLVRSGVTVTLVKDAPIVVGSAIEIIENKPPILKSGDKVQCACTTGGASAVDAIGTVLTGLP